MKLLKPHWVHHDDKPIFSVDVHQSGLKFATGGQGNDSGRVVIWNLLPVLSEKADLDASIPKILCQMDNHLACVNCVRWSQNGQFLASGSDDKLVMIWKISKGTSGVFSTGGITKNPESWKCIATLRGHAGDVLDLAWSPQDRWLASCSVDNTIIVWNVHNFPTVTAILKGHSGLVKGVTWDPVGKFLASQSDDRSVKIWKSSDWSCSSTITEPFEECGGTTHILRLSWSPDGQYLVSAHAMNGGGPTAQIIEREGWKCDKDFVGHRKAVTCVRFNSSILKRQAPKNNKAQQYCCLAVGSRDRSLSIWMTALQRPLVVIHDLFEDSILDLSWGSDKYILLACSGDGSIACLQFSEKELGTPLSEEDKNALYQRIYGRSATVDVNSSPHRDMIIENSELLNTLDEKLKPPQIPFVVQNQQITSQQIFHDDLKSTKQSIITPQKAINKQIETRTADGKRRITPMFIPLHQDSAVGCNDNAQELSSSSRNFFDCIPKKDESKNVINTTTSETDLIVDEIHLDNRLKKAIMAPAKTTSINKVHNENLKNSSPQCVNDRKTLISTRLNTNTTKGGGQSDFAKTAGDYRVQIQNSIWKSSLGNLSKISCWIVGKNEKLWDTVIGSSVFNFCVCSRYVLICSSDGSLKTLYIATGIQVLPIIHLPTAAIQCAFCPLGVLGGVITECGQLRVWNIEEQSLYITSSCADIMKIGHIVQFNIKENGIPFVLFSNGNSYAYSKQMQSWLILNSKDPVIRFGLYTTLIKDSQKNFCNFPIMSIQSSSPILHGMNPMDPHSQNWQGVTKLAFIENQIKLCEAVNSPDELKYWYSMLGYHLASCGTEKRIRLLLDDLLGPSHGGMCNQNDKILNIEKTALLEIVLNTLKMNPQWQRIYMEYAEQLNIFNEKYRRV